ncbi:hypothetical protein Droror1_Dr00009532 [Drosera rotundifolia]
MFKWRNEKIKAVFRLEFQATQVTDSGSWLTISVIPGDVGQATARLGKALVQDGACKWENPIYETVKLMRESKTGKVQEKIYHFVLGTGSPRKGLLGEASVNLADYTESVSPVSLSLQVKGSSSSAVLHVSIQNVQGADDSREVHENWEQPMKPRSRTLRSQMNDTTLDGSNHGNSIEDDKSTRNMVASTTMQLTRLDEIIAPKSQIVDHGSAVFPPSLRQNLPPQSKMPEAPIGKRHATERRKIEAQSLQGPKQPKHKNNNETSWKESEHTSSDTSVEQLKRHIFTLKREGEVAGLELESLRRQIAKENKKTKELLRKISSLTEERNALKIQCETSQLCHNSMNDNGEANNEATILREKIRNLQDELERQKEDRKQQDTRITELTSLTEDYKISEQKYYDLKFEFQQTQELLTKTENECASHLGILEDQDVKIERLEKLLRKQEDKYLEALETVDTLETQVKTLQDELEKQANEFEADCRDMAQAKFEQEQKTLNLEVDLKQTKLNSATAAKELQEEFGKLSEELESKFDENEKLTVEAQREASDLRHQITAMAEELQKANNELLSIKDDYGIKERKLSDQLIAQKNEFDQLLQKLEDECTELKVSKQNTEENYGILLMENENLIIDVQRLIERDNHLSEQLEQIEDLRSQMEQMKTTFDEVNKHLEITVKERDDLERKCASMQMEAQQAQEKLNEMKLSQYNKEVAAECLQSELEIHGHQQGDRKNNMPEEKLDCEKLRKKVMPRRGELQKRT